MWTVLIMGKLPDKHRWGTHTEYTGYIYISCNFIYIYGPQMFLF